MRYAAVFFILYLIFAALLIIKVKFAVDYLRNDRIEWIKLVFYIRNGFFRYEYEIPLLKKEREKIRFKLARGQRREIIDCRQINEKMTIIDVFTKIIDAKKYYENYGGLIDDIRTFLNKRKIGVELNVELKHGTGEAAQTGIIHGLLEYASAVLTAYISRYLTVKRKKIIIVPCYNKSIFEVDATCIFYVRLVHIIVVLKKIYYTKYLVEAKAKKTTGGEVSG